jgi:peptidoglycan/LPS O-acetylase OafA/YrhL
MANLEFRAPGILGRVAINELLLPMSLDVRKYKFIDALRGYAILGVILVHSTQSVTPVSGVLKWIAESGAKGVQLFFIASALTLSMSWHSRNSQEMSPIRNFYLRRFFRVAPMFYVAIVFYLFLNGFAASYWAPNGIQWWFVPLTALFLNGFHPESITSIVPGGWSIAVEMNFYLILPFLMLHLKKTKSLVLFLVFSLSIYAVSKYALLHLLLTRYPQEQQYLVSDFAVLSVFGQMPVFAIGLIAFSAYSKTANLRRIVAWGWLGFTSFILLAMMSPLHAKILGNYITFSAGFALFALTLAIYPVKVLVNSVVVHFGKLSFSMYLAHFAVLAFLAAIGLTPDFPPGDLSSMAFFLLVTAASAAISFITYSVVERNGVKLGARIIDRLDAPRRTSASVELTG